jgi:hypothetical protein
MKILATSSALSINVLSLLFTSLGFVSLLMGEVSYHERLDLVGGWSANQLIIGILTLYSFIILFNFPIYSKMFRLLLYIMPIGVSVLWSANIEYGIYKIGNLLIVSYIALVYFAVAIKLTTLTYFMKSIVIILTLLLFITIIFKLKFGFFDREVMFFLNGPIVFGKIMGIGAALSLVAFDSTKKFLFFMIFFLATVWTASKGPILSLLVVSTVYSIIAFDFKKNVLILFIVTALFFFLMENRFLFEEYGLTRILAVIDYYSTDSKTLSSISVRLGVAQETIKLILEHPIFGVGLGGWANSLINNGLMYPHNFFLEVFSEGGWLFGILFCVPYLIFLNSARSKLFYASLFLLISQQFSGDLLDSRYLLVFSILTVVYNNEIICVRLNQLKKRIKFVK